MLSTLSVRDAPGVLDGWRKLETFSSVDDHPLAGEFGRAYYPEVYGNDKQDETFAVLRDGTPRLLVPCTSSPGIIDYYGQPIKLFGPAAESRDDDLSTIEEVSCALERLAKIQRPPFRILLRDEIDEDAQSAISNASRKRDYSMQIHTTGLCELTEGEAALKSTLRKSFRSLVNWGRRNIRLSYVNRENPDLDAFASYQKFHRAIAGRDTRPQSSWDCMREWITRGRGELVLGFLDAGTLVAGTLIVDGTTTSYYASGVYDRERFDKPMGHWPLYHAIVRSHARGKSWFDLGDIPVQGSVSEKEYAIGFFKRGFATTFKNWRLWSLCSSGSPNSDHT